MKTRELSKRVGNRPACQALGVPESSYYRRLSGKPTGQKQPRKVPARTLSQEERKEVLACLCSERFVDRAPGEVVPTLLDEGRYLCSERTMYRILSAEHQVRERRDQRRHPEYVKPELVATGPNQVWSWDIERHEALLNLAVVKGHCLWHVAACQKKLRAAGAGERR